MRRVFKRIVPHRLLRQLKVADQLDDVRREIAELHSKLDVQNHLLSSLNHTVVHGGAAGLPLLVDVAERIRTDADAVIGSMSAIERVMHIAVRRLDESADRIGATGSTPGHESTVG